MRALHPDGREVHAAAALDVILRLAKRRRGGTTERRFDVGLLLRQNV